MPVVIPSIAHVAAGLKGHCPLVSGKGRRSRGGSGVVLLDVRSLQDPARLPRTLLQRGHAGLRGDHVQLILPVGPALAHPVSSNDNALSMGYKGHQEIFVLFRFMSASI